MPGTKPRIPSCGRDSRTSSSVMDSAIAIAMPGRMPRITTPLAQPAATRTSPHRMRRRARHPAQSMSVQAANRMTPASDACGRYDSTEAKVSAVTTRTTATTQE